MKSFEKYLNSCVMFFSEDYIGNAPVWEKQGNR